MKGIRTAAVLAAVGLLVIGGAYAASLIGVQAHDVTCAPMWTDGGPPDRAGAVIECADGGYAFNWLSVQGTFYADAGEHTAQAYIGGKHNVTPVQGYPLGGPAPVHAVDVNTRYGQLYCGATTTGVHLRVLCGRDPNTR